MGALDGEKKRKKRLKIAVKNVFVCLAIPKIFVRVNEFAGASVEFKRNRKKTFARRHFHKIHNLFLFLSQLQSKLIYSHRSCDYCMRPGTLFVANVLLLFLCFSILKVCAALFPSLSLSPKFK